VVKDQQDAVGNSDGAPLLENSIVVSISHDVAHDASILLTKTTWILELKMPYWQASFIAV